MKKVAAATTLMVVGGLTWAHIARAGDLESELEYRSQRGSPIVRVFQSAMKIRPSEAQKAEVASIVKAHQQDVRPAIVEAIDARIALGEVIHEESLDEERIRAAFAHLAHAAEDVVVKAAYALHDVRSVWTPEQRDARRHLRYGARDHALDRVDLVFDLVDTWIEHHTTK